MPKGYVDTPEGQIHYWDEGTGDPVILLHQAPSSLMMWSAFVPHLVGTGRRVIALDLPGYGMSDAPPSPPTVEYYARRVLDALSRMGIERFDGVGHHTGASVLMAASLEQPGRVRRIVAYGVALLDEETARALAEEEPPVFDEQATDILTWWKAFWTLSGPDLAPTVAPRCLGDLMLSGDKRPYGHNAVGRTDHRPYIDRLRVPTLALAGSREMLREETERSAGLSEWIRFHEIPDAGVFVADERPDELARVVDEFLRLPGARLAASS